MIDITADTLADALVAAIEDIDFGQTLNIQKWIPGLEGMGKGPFVVIGPPTMTRSGMYVAETELGSYDWLYAFPVEVMFDVGKATNTQASCLELVEAIIRQVDTFTDLRMLSSEDPKVTAAEPDFTDLESGGKVRSFFSYRLDIQIPTLSSYS